MFKFLKDKLKGAVKKFSKDIDEEAKTEEFSPDDIKTALQEDQMPEELKTVLEEEKPEELEPSVTEEQPEELKDDEIDFSKMQEELKEKDFDESQIEKELEKAKEKAEEEKIEPEEPVEIAPSEDKLSGYDEEKKGFFSKIKDSIVTKTLTVDKFNDLFFDLEVTLLENNVAVEVIEKIKQDLRRELVNKPIPRKNIENTILKALRESIVSLFDIESFDMLQKIKDKKPTIISFVGVNGSGKTTSISKFAHMLKKNGFSCVLAASDTFRAASIEQLEIHGKNLGIKVIKHDYGSDPAAVAFDAVNYAKSKGLDVVLIDTAGRLHSNKNLMDEIRKITRVAKPDLSIFVGESITGNDCVEQAKEFNDAVGFDGIILSKADIDEKGGSSISVSFVTKRPILYLGMGQEYGDLKKFDSKELLDKLGF